MSWLFDLKELYVLEINKVEVIISFFKFFKLIYSFQNNKNLQIYVIYS